MKPVTLRPFCPSDQAEVKNLVLAGLAEHWGTLDPAKNPDLNDIAASYAAGAFWVACQAGRIVGSGALQPCGQGVAQMVRMSVARDVRRQGVGRAIVSALLAEARRQGLQRIVLETTAAWHEVIVFYLNCGFHITHHAGEDVYFEMRLARAGDEISP